MSSQFAQREAQRIQGQLQLALNAFHQNDLAQAREICTRILDAQPQVLQARQLMGLIEMSLERPDQAFEHLKVCAEAAPHEATFLVNYALVLNQKSEVQKAKGLLHQAAKEDPLSPEAYYHLACIAQKSDKEDEMRQYLQQALERAPDFDPALELYRQAGASDVQLKYYQLRGLDAQGHRDLVLAQLKEACQAFPAADLLRSLAMELHLKQGELQAAQSQLEQLEDPDFTAAQPWKALILSEAGEFEQAYDLLKGYLKSKPQDWQHWVRFLDLHLPLEEYDEIPERYALACLEGSEALSKSTFQQLLAPPEQQSLALFLHAKLEHNLERLSLRSDALAHRDATEALLERLETPLNPPSYAELNQYLQSDRSLPALPAQWASEPLSLQSPPEDLETRFFAYQPHYVLWENALPESVFRSLLNFRDQAYIWHHWLQPDFSLRADLSTGLWQAQWIALIAALREALPTVIGDLPLLHFSAYQQRLKPDQQLKAQPDFANARVKVFLELETGGEHIILDRAVPNFADNFLFERFRQDKTALETWMQTQIERMYTVKCRANSLLILEAEVPHVFRREESAARARLQRSGLEFHFGPRHAPWPQHD